MSVALPRTVKIKVPLMRGGDIDAHGRAMHRLLKDGQLGAYSKQPTAMRETFGVGKRTLAKKCAAKLGLPQYGVVGPGLYAAMRDAGAYDSVCDALLVKYTQPKMPSLVYPHDRDFASYTGGFLHETGGIGGNWSLDFMAAPGTPVLAPESGTVSRTSGNAPATGLHGRYRDVFGWSVYLRCKSGFYYSTHYGKLNVRGDDNVRVGDVLGWVGDWPYDRGRSHTHLGYTSLTRLAYVSQRKIRDVAAAPRVRGSV